MMRSLKVKFINGFSNITTCADVGSFTSATHVEPDSVSNSNGPVFSTFVFIVITQMEIIARTSVDNAEHIARINFFDLGLNLRFLSDGKSEGKLPVKLLFDKSK
ncbi:hypothetical protein TSUD_69170 [Trifolium subterraneum]|uniref:Uncharacterized protein n=1 Tax=Trifolium subterraneum TaxID=3900 RepID=A0A2Z6P7U7_TRISU|nr:hypothetical protein TSUD_69170 [Trifolium subterraneum]